MLAAFLFVRVTDGGRTSATDLGLYLAAVLVTQLSIALHNGWCDRHADAMAKPWRLIPRGVLDPALVLFGAIALLILGLTLAWLIAPAVAQLVAAGTACGWAYNAWLKRTPFSWLPFALALPTLALCSLLVADRLDGFPYGLYLIGAPLVLAIHLGDSIPDIEGDRTAGSHGLAVALGRRRSLVACWLGMLAAILLAVALRPFAIPPGPLVALSLLLLGCAVLASLRSLRVQWYLIVASSIAVAVDWVAALAS